MDEVEGRRSKRGSSGKCLVLLVDDGRDVWRVRPTVALRGDVERCVCVVREAAEEELKEGVHVFTGDGARVNGRALVSIGETDVNWLVEEDDIGVLVPGVLVVGHILALVGNRARPKLEEQAGGRRATRATVEPEEEWRVVRVVTRLEEPTAMLRPRIVKALVRLTRKRDAYPPRYRDNRSTASRPGRTDQAR